MVYHMLNLCQRLCSTCCFACLNVRMACIIQSQHPLFSQVLLDTFNLFTALAVCVCVCVCVCARAGMGVRARASNSVSFPQLWFVVRKLIMITKEGQYPEDNFRSKV